MTMRRWRRRLRVVVHGMIAMVDRNDAPPPPTPRPPPSSPLAIEGGTDPCVICRDAAPPLASYAARFEACACRGTKFHAACWHAFVVDTRRGSTNCPQCRSPLRPLALTRKPLAVAFVATLALATAAAALGLVVARAAHERAGMMLVIAAVVYDVAILRRPTLVPDPDVDTPGTSSALFLAYTCLLLARIAITVIGTPIFVILYTAHAVVLDGSPWSAAWTTAIGASGLSAVIGTYAILAYRCRTERFAPIG